MNKNNKFITYVAGLDLSAKETKCSGYSVIDVTHSNIIKLECLYSDRDILKAVISDHISVLAIDSPLIPKPYMRKVDKLAISRGFKVFPPNFKYMKNLTLRAWNLYTWLSKHNINIKVIETHPRSALINSGVEDIDSLLKALNIEIDKDIDTEYIHRNKDLRDAVVASIVAYCYLKKQCVDEIRDVDGTIYIISRTPHIFKS